MSLLGNLRDLLGDLPDDGRGCPPPERGSARPSEASWWEGRRRGEDPTEPTRPWPTSVIADGIPR